jgi:hypothetical protein
MLPQDKARFYDKGFDSFDSMRPVQLKNGEYFLTPDIYQLFDKYINGNYPDSIKLAALHTKAELQAFELREITETDLKSGTLPEEVELFPYHDRPIRVFIEHKQVTAMIETPYKPLIDFALLCPYIKDDSGITLWLKEFANEHFTAEEVQGVLQMFNAEITIK